MSFLHAQNAVLLLTKRRKKKFFCRFNFFFRRFDKHLILYASVKVWKGLFETVKIQYKKKEGIDVIPSFLYPFLRIVI